MKLTKAQQQALLDVDANSCARAYGHGRRTVYKLVSMGLVEVLTSTDAGGHKWWAGWRVTDAGRAALEPIKREIAGVMDLVKPEEGW